MKIRIKKIAPLQAGKMLAVIYALFSIILVPILLLVALAGPQGSGGMSVVMVIVVPVMYIVLGFIGGVIGAFIYNLVAGWMGGIEIDYEPENT